MNRKSGDLLLSAVMDHSSWLLERLIEQLAKACAAVYRAQNPAMRNRVRHPEKFSRADPPLKRKPNRIRVRATANMKYSETKMLLRCHGPTTVCEEAACPNVVEC
jgi:hypothetical protein